MVVLMLALELLLSTIGSAVVALVSFVFATLPYALAALPLYILYRLARAVWPKLSRRLRRKPKAARTARPRPAARKVASPSLHVRPEPPPPAKAASGKPPAARVYGEGLDILKRQMRGPLRRGDIPWFLAFGVGGPALLATDPTHVRWPEDGSGEFGSWWFCEGAAILHAGSDSADGSKLAESWPSLVAAMRARPMRRPLDGVLLMVGADELRAAAEREPPRRALAMRAAALRARLKALRDELGVICPVHVVVVRAEALEGFTDLCAAVPAAMLGSVLGWTNPHDWTLFFDPRWVDEAFEATRADLALLEADALAAGTAGVRLPLLPASLDTLRHPLAMFLDSVLGCEESEEPFPLRGIALTGAHTPAGGGRRPAFARDLLPGRAFAEPGYGRPSDMAFRRARRRRRQAQIALAASVLGLSAAAWQGSAGVSGSVPAVAAGVGDLRHALLSRDATTDAALVGRVIAATALMERESLATPLLPTSLLSGFDEDKRRLASATMRRAVLRPIRDALLPSATMADLPPVTNPHRLEELPSYRRLSDQLERIADRQGALERYDRFRRSSGSDELLALSESVYGAVPRPPLSATDGFITRIAAGASLPNLDAKTIAAAVRVESVQFATALAGEYYSRNPLLVRASALAERLRTLPDMPSAEDAEDIRRLVEAVVEAGAWPIAAALRAPSHGLPDAVKVMLQRASLAELPGRDASERIAETLSTTATAARATLLALEAPSLGPLFTAPEDGGVPVLSPAVAALPPALAALVPEEPPAVQEPPKADAPKAGAPKAGAPKAEPDTPRPPAAGTGAPTAPEAKPVKPAPAEAASPPPAPSKTLADLPEPASATIEPVQPVALAAMPTPPREPQPDAGTATAALATTFSQTLAGRFPFVRPDAARRAPDADPQEVRRFLEQVDRSRAAILKAPTPELSAFLERLDAARPMLDAVIRSAPLRVRLTYGVNRAQEVGAEHIIDWSVRTGTTAVGTANPDALIWRAGQPLLLSFRWAAGSPYRPKNAAASEAEAAVGDTLTIAERGPWALLRLLQSRVPSPAGAGQGSLLRIALPTQTIGGNPVDDTVLFMNASITGGTRSDTALRALDLPASFPQW